MTVGIFVRPARLLAARIFSAARGGRHMLVCEFDAESPAPNAVVVPVPAAGPGAVEKIDAGEFRLGWDGRRTFFDDLHAHFIEPPIGRAGGGQAFVGSGGASSPQAVAGTWRAFTGVTVPSDAAELFDSADALEGLEPALRPLPDLQALLRGLYPRQAFALCRLPAGLAQAFVAVHYEPGDHSRIFFPLRQVTDGRTAAPTAAFSHTLFGQGVALDERRFSFMKPAVAAGPPPAAAPPGPPGAPQPPTQPAQSGWPFPSFVEAWTPVDLAFRRGTLSNEDLSALPAPWRLAPSP